MGLSFHKTIKEPIDASLITLDLEYDYGGDTFSYHCELMELREFSITFNMPINIFVEARLLRDPTVVKILLEWYGDVNLHCYDHRMKIDGPNEIRKSQKLFADTFGYNALGYRSTRYSLNSDIIYALMDNGFKFDSSYLQNPLRRNNLNSIDAEVSGLGLVGRFRSKEQVLWEFPVSSLNTIKIPVIYSYLSLIGIGNFRILKKIFGLKSPAVLDFHMVDLFPNLSAMNVNDSLIIKVGYGLNALKKNGFFKLDKVVNTLNSRKITYTQLMEHYDK